MSISPIDGSNRKHLGLENLPIHKGPLYAAYQAIGLELFKRFGDLAHGLSWQSFHRHQVGRVYAIWHHRKDALGLKITLTPPAVPLKEDAEWAALIAEFDTSWLMKIRKPAR